jgi:hypothetical protein
MLFALSLSKCIANLGEEDLNSLALTDDHISCVSDEFTKEDLVMKRLWEKANMERHMAEARKGSRRRR